MRTLVVGYGSIGARHARLLAALGCDVAVVSSREVSHEPRFSSVAVALTVHRPEYIVLASATHLHHPQLIELGRAGFAGVTLVEKPLFGNDQPITIKPRGPVFVAYNLRFHPLIARLRELLASERVLSVQAYAGQYLPEWRPATDYRASYSARAEQGGGVLRDLSHELDYLTWMFGGWTHATALGGRFSDLEITSDDVFDCLFAAPLCPVVSVQLNYLDRVGRRRVLVNTARHTFEVDFVAGILSRDSVVERFAVDRDDTYNAMHRALLEGTHDIACTLEQGARTMRLIRAAQSATMQPAWVTHA